MGLEAEEKRRENRGAERRRGRQRLLEKNDKERGLEGGGRILLCLTFNMLSLSYPPFFPSSIISSL